MKIRSLSSLLEDIRLQIQSETVSFNELLEAFHERGFGFFLFIFALPAALPLPGLGVNAIIAIPLLLLTAQQALGRNNIWIPKKLRQKAIKKKTIDGFISSATPWVKRIEFLIKPRLSFITHGIFSYIIGILGFIMAIAVSIPIPLTNTIPAFGIALMSIGVLTRDGLAIIIGAIIGTIWVSLLIFVTLHFGAEGISIMKEFIKSLI